MRLAALATLLLSQQATAQYYWDALEPPREGAPKCRGSPVSTPGICLDGGLICLSMYGGVCPEGCVDNYDVPGQCTGTAVCPPPRPDKTCPQEGCIYTPTPDHVCPVGCQKEDDACVPCPPAYDACGKYGGCNPHGLTSGDSDEGSEPFRCFCLPGFGGELCNLKGTTTAGYLVFWIWGFLGLFLLAFFSMNGYFRVDRYSWKWPTYNITPIRGLVVDSELIIIALEYLQLAGMAFGPSIPWTNDSSWVVPAVKIMRFIGVDMWPASWDSFTFGWKLTFTSAVWFIAEMIYLKFMRSEYHPHGGIGKDHEHELLTLLRRKVEKIRSDYLMLMLIPGTSVYSSTFFSCTYYPSRANTFDPDRSLSCWRSTWWWCYAFISFFGLGVLLVTVLIRDKKFGSMEHPYPATRQFGFFFSMTKILATIIAVGMGSFHVRESCVLTIVLLVLQLAYVLVRQPWAHVFLNRFSAAWIVINIWCYGVAIYAFELGDPASPRSSNVFGYGLCLICLIFIAVESYNFTRVPDREHPAGGFGQHHVAWQFPEVYRVSQHGMPLDRLGMTCEDHFDIHTGKRTCKGSGRPAALTDDYQEGGRPPRHHKRQENATQIRATIKERKVNMALHADARLMRPPKIASGSVALQRDYDAFENPTADVESAEVDGFDAESKRNLTLVEVLQAKSTLTDRELLDLLQLLPTSALVRRAEGLEQANDDAVRSAIEELPDTQALIDVIFATECSRISRETMAMQKMSLSDVKEKAAQHGLSKDALHACFDEPDPKQAMIDLVIATMEGEGDASKAEAIQAGDNSDQDDDRSQV